MAILRPGFLTHPPHARTGGTLTVAVCAIVLLCLFERVHHQAVAQTPVSDDKKVKAVFLSKFPSFVTWPESAFSENRTHIEIGVLGGGPINNHLEEAIRGEVIKDRTMRIRNVSTLEEATRCHILFFTEENSARFEPFLAMLQRVPVLTVGESEGFTKRGGILNFKTVDGRIRLEVNPDAAATAHLKISSKLLSVSKIVQ